MKKISKLNKQYLVKQILWITGRKTTVKKKITSSQKKKSYIASLFTFFEKVSAICEFSFLYECSNLCITLLTNNI